MNLVRSIEALNADGQMIAQKKYGGKLGQTETERCKITNDFMAEWKEEAFSFKHHGPEVWEILTDNGRVQEALIEGFQESGFETYEGYVSECEDDVRVAMVRDGEISCTARNMGISDVKFEIMCSRLGMVATA